MVEHLLIGSVPVQLRWADTRATPLAEAVCRYLHAEKTKAPGTPIRLDIEVGSADPGGESGGEVLGTFDNGFVLERTGDVLQLRGGAYRARLDVARGEAVVRVPESNLGGAGRWTVCALVLECLSLLLRRRGFYGLHAAALAREGRGLVITAASDSGKSTLALRLVQSGWQYLSDDTVLLRPTPTHLDVLGLRSHFSLDPEAEAVFPGLATGRAAPLLKEDKWAVDLEQLHPARRATSCVPHALVFPEIVDAEESTLAPITPTEAFGRLLGQSSLARLKLDDTRGHLDVLAALARSASAYHLRSGRDLLRDPARADVLLRPLLEASPA